MKQALLTCAILMAAINAVHAQKPQQVSKSNFTTQVTALSNYMQQGNTGGETGAIKTLDGLMNQQITWLQYDINSTQADYNSCKTKTLPLIDLKNKGQATAGSQSELNRLQQIMTLDTKKIGIDNKSLGIEQSMYKDFRTLTGDIARISADQKSKISSDLNNFAATLQ